MHIYSSWLRSSISKITDTIVWELIILEVHCLFIDKYKSIFFSYPLLVIKCSVKVLKFNSIWVITLYIYARNYKNESLNTLQLILLTFLYFLTIHQVFRLKSRKIIGMIIFSIKKNI